MAKKAEEKKEGIVKDAKSQETQDQKKVKKIEAAEAVVDEKELLHEAEEREKERKEIEEKEKEEAKIAVKEAKKATHEEKKAEKANVRKKPRHGKKYRALAERIDSSKEYSIADAVKLAKETSVTKFDATVEMHLRLSSKLENARGTFTLPGGAVKEKKVEKVTDKNVEELISKIKAGKIDFDIIVAHPSAMPKLASVAKILGPKGLMPNPKSGTVSEDVDVAVEEFKGGRVEYKADKSNNVHLAIAKASFADEKIVANVEATINQFPANRIESIHITTSMGPSIKVAAKK